LIRALRAATCSTWSRAPRSRDLSGVAERDRGHDPGANVSAAVTRMAELTAQASIGNYPLVRKATISATTSKYTYAADLTYSRPRGPPHVFIPIGGPQAHGALGMTRSASSCLVGPRRSRARTGRSGTARRLRGVPQAARGLTRYAAA